MKIFFRSLITAFRYINAVKSFEGVGTVTIDKVIKHWREYITTSMLQGKVTVSGDLVLELLEQIEYTNHHEKKKKIFKN